MKAETRAVSLRLANEPLPSRDRISKRALRERIRCIADSGFNAIVLNCFSNGFCLFPSESTVQTGIVKQHPRFRRYNALALILEEATAAGLVLYTEIDAFVLGSASSPGVRFLLRKHPGWLIHNRHNEVSPIGDDSENLYFCPSNPELRHFLGDLLNELTEQYPISGTVLRFQRFPDLPSRQTGENTSLEAAFCFCKTCKELIHDDINIDLDILEIAETSPAYRKWQEWNEKEFYELLSYLKLRFEKGRSGAPLFALLPRRAMHNTKNSIHARSLHRALAEKLVNIAIISNYNNEPQLFDDELADDCSAFGNEMLLMPAIAPAEANLLDPLTQITRKYPVAGLLCSEDALRENPPEAEPTAQCLPVFAESAFVPEVNPESAVAQFSNEIIELTGADSSLAGFLRDMQKLLYPPATLTLEKLDSLVKNLSSIEEKLLKGELNVPADIDRISRNLKLIKHLLWLFPFTER
jgi:hypothetical protein